MRKPVCEAIEQKFPMHWETDPDSGVFRLRLIADTYTYESGAVRTRTLWKTYDARHAHYVHGEIVRQGGKVSEPTPREIYEQWQEDE